MLRSFMKKLRIQYDNDIRAIEESYIETDAEFNVWLKDVLSEVKEYESGNCKLSVDDDFVYDNRVQPGEFVWSIQDQSYNPEPFEPGDGEYESGCINEEGRHVITDEDIWAVIGKPQPLRRKSKHKSGKKHKKRR